MSAMIEEPRREFPFAERQFRFVAERVYKLTGIRLPEAKREMMYARLTRRLRVLGFSTFDQYIELLESDPREWENCVNALTTNVTAFFRENHHFAILAQLAKEKAVAGRPFRVWSAGCSSGEEPYSIAMTLAQTLGAGRFEILASDLDTQVLATAQAGVYPLAAVNVMSPDQQRAYFHRGSGPYERKARVQPWLVEHVRFQRINLMDTSWPIHSDLDAIFCRNVMIYFDKATQERLVARFAGPLAPHGLFFAGHAESLLDKGRHFSMKGQTVYQLVANRGGAR